MKKITTNQWLIGGGIVALLFILYKKQQDKKNNITVKKDITEIDTEIDTSDIPKECLNGFTVDGVQYYIKDNKYIKE